MLRWAGGVTLRQSIESKSRKTKTERVYIRGSFKVAPISGKIPESRLRWYGHVMRRPEDHVVEKCLYIAIKKRGRGRPQIKWLTSVQNIMKMLGLTMDDTN